MTAFQKNFIHTFYLKLATLTGSTDYLQKALNDFQSIACESNPDRYLGKKTFGIEHWPDEQAAVFTAAMAEALVQTQLEYAKTVNDNIIYQITSASELIKSEIIPDIINKLYPDNCIKELPRIIPSLIHQLSNASGPGNNYYSLFGGAAIATTLALGTAALIWKGVSSPTP